MLCALDATGGTMGIQVAEGLGSAGDALLLESLTCSYDLRSNRLTRDAGTVDECGSMCCLYRSSATRCGPGKDYGDRRNTRRRQLGNEHRTCPLIRPLSNPLAVYRARCSWGPSKPVHKSAMCTKMACRSWNGPRRNLISSVDSGLAARGETGDAGQAWRQAPSVIAVALIAA
jgi:hypothetical protein